MSLSAGLGLMLTEGLSLSSGLGLLLTQGFSPSAGFRLMLTAGFVSLCWLGVEESLEAVELQVSGCDDDQTLENRPAVHISGV